ncbi:MAG: sulfite exporter TauE/SafE family protein [Acidimicrobiia bacterium]
MHLDGWVSLAGLLVGFVVGLTGMGGGALMTPILVLGFGIQPLAAVSSDLVAAVVMKPVGGAVHARRGTVNTGIVRWLALGSVPAAFAGVLVLKALGGGQDLQDRLQAMLGAVLLLAAGAMLARWAVQAYRARHGLAENAAHAPIRVRRARTVAIGILGGLVVGMTSVGSGSIMIVLLMVLYPALTTNELVGTDLVQAIPLVLAAALGHVLFGDLQVALTTSLLVGAVPGVYVGARLSSRARDSIVRPALVLVLTLSALKLLDVGTPVLGVLLAAGAAATVVGNLVLWRRRVTRPVGPESVYRKPPTGPSVMPGRVLPP